MYKFKKEETDTFLHCFELYKTGNRIIDIWLKNNWFALKFLPLLYQKKLFILSYKLGWIPFYRAWIRNIPCGSYMIDLCCWLGYLNNYSKYALGDASHLRSRGHVNQKSLLWDNMPANKSIIPFFMSSSLQKSIVPATDIIFIDQSSHILSKFDFLLHHCI